MIALGNFSYEFDLGENSIRRGRENSRLGILWTKKKKTQKTDENYWYWKTLFLAVMLRVAIIQFNLDSIRESLPCAPCFRASPLSRAFRETFTTIFFSLGVCRRLRGRKSACCFSRRKSLLSVCDKNISINHFNNYPSNIIFIVVALILQSMKDEKKGVKSTQTTCFSWWM